jgi:hypothetical protein
MPESATVRGTAAPPRPSSHDSARSPSCIAVPGDSNPGGHSCVWALSFAKHAITHSFFVLSSPFRLNPLKSGRPNMAL